MRRSPIVLAATIAGTTGVLAFHTHSPAATAAVASSTTTTTTTASGSGTPTGTRYGPAQVKVTPSPTARSPTSRPSSSRTATRARRASPPLPRRCSSRRSCASRRPTSTSAGYLQSLQSALDKLGYQAPDGSVATAQVPG